MTVDLEAIARRTNCELTSLRSALPLLEQGYAPPFLARYRRDELGGLSEHSMWTLYRAIREAAWIKNRRDDLMQRLEQLPQADPALGRAIRSASSKRVIDRLARRVRSESGEASSPAMRVASRILSPEKGDPHELSAIAALMGLAGDSEAIESQLDAALVSRLAGHPQIQGAAVRWLFNNAKIRILDVKDSHLETAENNAAGNKSDGGFDEESSAGSSVPSSAQVTGNESLPKTDLTTTESGDASPIEAVADVEASIEAEPDTTESWPTPEELAAAVGEAMPSSDVTETSGGASEAAAPHEQVIAGEQPIPPKPKTSNKKGKAKPQAKVKELKPVKKISPRQRRRRWLVSVLQPLAGKEILAQRLTAFQTLMIGRGLRSGVVHCQFVYDTEKLSDHLQRTAGGLNESFAAEIRSLVAANDAAIRESAEAAWWDELLESAATRLVGVAADHLDAQISRGGVEAKVVLSIDAMGPRTAAVAIVAADGRLLHTEDIPCQLSAALRTAAVTRVGELIHQYGVDLIVISNGPSRRACLVILHELVEQSTPGSIRWTIAERSGADVYAGSELGNREMRSTPRRFRSAAWLAFSVLRPSQAVTKVDPMRLRLGSFQRELSEDALWPALRDVMTSGVSRGGVDVNSAPVDWLCQLPGVNRDIAAAIDEHRRQSLFTCRTEVTALEQWTDPASARQAIAFLRVFGSSEPLDGTLVHPDDYALAKKLATVLKLELPPPSPPGYQPPNFDDPTPAPARELMAAVSNVEEVTSIVSEATENFAADIQPTGDGEPAGDAIAESPADELLAENETLIEQTVEPEAAASVVNPVVEIHAPVTQPKPDVALINKCVKEWQVGARRVRHVVETLCNPFGEEDATGNGAPHAVMTKVPKLADLTVGEQVIGVIVGVTEFGAFVEMSPECSGLVHVSRVADRYVEDLHEAIQVGDVITAWVTNIDTKRRRVGLSAISPEREAELERHRQERREESNHRGQYGSRSGRGDNQRGGQNRGGQSQSRDSQGDNRSSGQRSGGGGNRSAQPQPTGAATASSSQSNDSRSGRNDSRPDARGGRGDSRPGGRSDSRPGGRSDGRGDRPGGGGDSRRGGQRGGRRDRDDRDDGPSSYSTRVPRNDTPAEPISDAMAKGDEPLRSFGDLMQFFKKAQPEPTIKPKVIEPVAETPKAEVIESPSQVADQPTVPDHVNELASVNDGAAPES